MIPVGLARRRRTTKRRGARAEPAVAASRAGMSESPPSVEPVVRSASPPPESEPIPWSTTPSASNGRAPGPAVAAATTAREPPAARPRSAPSPRPKKSAPPPRRTGAPAARPTARPAIASARQPAARPRPRPFPAGAPTITCEIKWVRAKGRSEFQAIALGPDGAEALIARSPSFRWRLPVSPDATPAAAAAHDTLVRQLLAARWQLSARGGLLNWYGDRFRALASESLEPLAAAAPRTICEIKWVRVDGRSEFHAIARAPDGAEALIARSPSFRWRLPVSPDATPAAAAAHDTLVRQLLATGWTPCEGGGLLHWYGERFRSSEPTVGQPGMGIDA